MTITTHKDKGALILTHVQQEGSCSFGLALLERGFRLRSHNTTRYGATDIDPLRPDLLVIMGGPISVYQADEFPFLKDEIKLLKIRAEAGLPTLGICLGAQLLAAALGSKVYQGKNGAELGWHPLSLTEAGKQSSIRHIQGSKTNMFHWHGDTFDLPNGAELLASSENYPNQIFKYGEKIMGIQCHPEVMKEQLEEWMVTHNHQVSGKNAKLNVHQLRKDIAANIETMNTQAHIFFDEWLEGIGL